MFKIAVIFPFDAPFSSKFGGAASRWVYEVLSKIKPDNETEISILVPNPKTKEPFILENQKIKYLTSFAGIVYKNLPLSDFKRDKIASYFWCLSVAMNSKKYDAILIENRLYYALMLRKLGYKGKIIVHLHNELFRENNPEYLSKLDNNIDMLISCCEAVLKPLKTEKPKLYNKSTVIYNGVNTEFFRPGLKEKKNNVILFVGRIVEQKGVHLLLDVYEKLLIKFPDLILKLAGSATFGGERPLTDYEKTIKTKVENINSTGGDIQILGFVEHDIELPKLYNEATLLCMSSFVTEAFPLVILEAMFCATTVVAPILGGIPESLPNMDLLFKEGNAVELEQIIDSILSNPEKRKAIERENYDFALKNFNWDKIAMDFNQFLTKLPVR
jgi:glycosyltransferase involved in cell wall biosynthesis